MDVIGRMCWKKCPDGMSHMARKYTIEDKGSMTARKSDMDGECTIIGSETLPPNEVTSWGVEILSVKHIELSSIFVGVAPFDISPYEGENEKKCGWYINCSRLMLRSGPPHNYSSVAYGPRYQKPEMRPGYTVGVVMDTTKGKLSFVMDGVTYGTAYKGIPLDKPLVPCVLLYYIGDTVKFTPYYVEEIMPYYPVYPPENIVVEKASSHTITLKWDAVEDASGYQVKVCGSKFIESVKTNTFTKEELANETEYSFRVRTIEKAAISDWSDVIKGRTAEVSFGKSAWAEFPDKDHKGRKNYYLDGSQTIATHDNGYMHVAIIGNATIPPNTVTSWKIKVVKTDQNSCHDFFIGVAPADIVQDDRDNYKKCGWYLGCYESMLFSGPPFYYNHESSRRYGPRKEGNKYFQTGDVIGVMMDTTFGDLSFFFDSTYMGVAYEGIPLDKPLVPCAILGHRGDAIMFDPSGVDQCIASNVTVPSGITAKPVSCDSIFVKWDPVGVPAIFHVEVEGRRNLEVAFKNMITITGLEPATAYQIRVRTVWARGLSEWSAPVREITRKSYFDVSGWRECPEDLYPEKMYTVHEKNPKYVSKTVPGFCTILGAAAIPVGRTTSWKIKILKFSGCRPYDFFVGISQYDIEQNYTYNYRSRGWHFECGAGELWSGPPQSFMYRRYGCRGESLSKGTKFELTMDMKKGELSYVMWGVDCGTAFKDIPLDKPLFPSVIIKEKTVAFKLITVDDEERADPTKDEEEEEEFGGDKDCIIS